MKCLPNNSKGLDPHRLWPNGRAESSDRGPLSSTVSPLPISLVCPTDSKYTGEVVTSLGRETPLTAGPQVSWPLPRFVSFARKVSGSPCQTTPKDLQERTELIWLYMQIARWAMEGPKGERVLFQVPAGLAAPGNKEPPLWCGCPRRIRP